MRRSRIKVIRRPKWGARTPASAPLPMAPGALRSWIHHTAGHQIRDPRWTEKLYFRKACEYVRSIQNFHMLDRGWNDIGYNFVIVKPYFRKCWVFEGRGWGIVGAHTEGDNSKSVGIVLAGNFDTERLPRRMVHAVREMLDRGVALGHLDRPRAKHPTGGHQQAPGASTACPGRNVMAVLERMTWSYQPKRRRG